MTTNEQNQDADGFGHCGHSLHSLNESDVCTECHPAPPKTEAEVKARLLAYIKANCKPVDCEERFRSMLDDCYSFEKVGGPFASMSPSRVLEEMDPTAFRCGVNDYMDGEDVTEVSGETYDDSDLDEAREQFVSELETDLEDDLDEEASDEEIEASKALLEFAREADLSEL